jgi:fibronectin type 3 domain-containing protein
VAPVATSYKVYRAASKNATYNQIATPSSAVYDDMVNLTSVGTSYWYKIVSVNAAGDSNESTAKGITVTNPVVYVFGRTSNIGRGIRIEIGGSTYTYTGTQIKSSPSGFSGCYVTPDIPITPGNKTYSVDNYKYGSTITWAGWFDPSTENFKPLRAYEISIDKDKMYPPKVYPNLEVEQ